MIEDLDLIPQLDAVLLSEEEGVEKPSCEIFKRACERLGVKAHETVHVGDELDWYARRALQKRRPTFDPCPAF